MNVTWQDGRLAAKVLFEALAALKITEDVYVVVNAYRDDGSLDVSIMEGIQTLQGQGWLVIGMGKGSYWIPGSYVTSTLMSAPSNALPRFRTLCTNSKKPR